MTQLSCRYLQAVSLGERIRSRYGSLLQQQAWMAGVEVRSTPMRRTIETAAGVLTGLLGESPAAAPVEIQLHSDRVADDYLVRLSTTFLRWSLVVYCLGLLLRFSGPRHRGWLRSLGQAQPSFRRRTAKRCEISRKSFRRRPAGACHQHPNSSRWGRSMHPETICSAGWRKDWSSGLCASHASLPCWSGDSLCGEKFVSPPPARRCRVPLVASSLCSGGLLPIFLRLTPSIAWTNSTADLWTDYGRQHSSALRDGMGECWRQSMIRLHSIAAAQTVPAAPRLCLFSGHDSTVFPLMMCLLPQTWGR
eukprot:SAG31_NODE_1321_length_8801_cov_7.086532_7_plen_306_part_00